MTASFAFPPRGFGPGSMPPDNEEGLQYLAMPSGVHVYAAHTPEIDDPARVRPAIGLLEQVRDLARAWTPGHSTIVRRAGLDAASQAVFDDALGEGEVSIVLEDAAGRIEVQESVFAGVWSLRAARMARVRPGPCVSRWKSRPFRA
ncbi:hydrogenase expression/formation protein [Komagataeibacter kakiaceti]|uniref:hydrogenase expression/formation protein n=1 Tax=Komagataeibacter kakiaceti TaxID=943261 RepID=UPI000A8F7506|nr:hydrogenase expression/formation protein [Komagataeibacter kakiaceti]